MLGCFNIQDFVSTMMTTGLFQMISDPTHKAGHTLVLVLCVRQDEYELVLEELSRALLPWANHYLVELSLARTQNLFKGSGTD